METRVIHFWSEGSKLEGDYFLPDGMKPGEKRPAILLCHGYSGIRSVILPDYAKHFVDHGYVVMGFDYRGFGGSEGPKWRIMAMEQIDDIRNALTWLEAQAEVDADRIGIWGTSNGGAHVVQAAAVDKRVKCAVGQVGFGDGWRLIMDSRSPAEREELLALLAKDRRERVVEGTGGAAGIATLLHSKQTREFIEPALKVMPDFYSEIPWASAEATMEYRPIDVVHKIAPRALMLIGAEKDDLCKIDGYKEMFDKAGEPKRWLSYPITHYQIYEPEWVAKSAAAALEFYDEHLRK